MTQTAPSADPQIALLRHTLATVAYRGAKALRGVPDDFPTFKAGPKTRTPARNPRAPQRSIRLGSDAM